MISRTNTYTSEQRCNSILIGTTNFAGAIAITSRVNSNPVTVHYLSVSCLVGIKVYIGGHSGPVTFSALAPILYTGGMTIGEWQAR